MVKYHGKSSWSITMDSCHELVPRTFAAQFWKIFTKNIFFVKKYFFCSKISIIFHYFGFCPKFLLWPKLSIFDQRFNFLIKLLLPANFATTANVPDVYLAPTHYPTGLLVDVSGEWYAKNNISAGPLPLIRGKLDVLATLRTVFPNVNEIPVQKLALDLEDKLCDGTIIDCPSDSVSTKINFGVQKNESQLNQLR